MEAKTNAPFAKRPARSQEAGLNSLEDTPFALLLQCPCPGSCLLFGHGVFHMPHSLGMKLLPLSLTMLTIRHSSQARGLHPQLFIGTTKENVYCPDAGIQCRNLPMITLKPLEGLASGVLYTH